ncbi:hypothetical protein ZWY2020_040217 [Hordeum vulgare]|nr:hypothetical protein ZWY2020_040217 [Hordeum vulgare]
MPVRQPPLLRALLCSSEADGLIRAGVVADGGLEWVGKGLELARATGQCRSWRRHRDGVGADQNQLATTTGERGRATMVSTDLVEGMGAAAMEPVAEPVEHRDLAASAARGGPGWTAVAGGRAGGREMKVVGRLARE